MFDILVISYLIVAVIVASTLGHDRWFNTIVGTILAGLLWPLSVSWLVILWWIRNH